MECFHWLNVYLISHLCPGSVSSGLTLSSLLVVPLGEVSFSRMSPLVGVVMVIYNCTCSNLLRWSSPHIPVFLSEQSSGYTVVIMLRIFSGGMTLGTMVGELSGWNDRYKTLLKTCKGKWIKKTRCLLCSVDFEGIAFPLWGNLGPVPSHVHHFRCVWREIIRNYESRRRIQ